MTETEKEKTGRAVIPPDSKLKVLADRSEGFVSGSHEDILTIARCFYGVKPETRQAFAERLLAVGSLLRSGNFRLLNAMNASGGPADQEAMAAGLDQIRLPEKLGAVPSGNVQGNRKPPGGVRGNERGEWAKK